MLARRVHHVVTENDRVIATADLLRSRRTHEIGPLLTGSHRPLRDDFEVNVPELDTVVDAALAAGALGARTTGDGFGGSAIALVPAAAIDAITEAVSLTAESAGHLTPTIWPAIPSAGAAGLGAV